MRPALFVAFGYRVGSAPVFAGLAALASYFHFERRKSRLGVSEEDFWGIIASLALGTFAGAIGFYALLYGGGLRENVSFLWRTANVPGGSYLGAYLGAAGAAWAYCRARGLRFAPVGDVLGAAAPLGLSIMRVGCLLHGCCHGKPTTLPWGLVFEGRSAVPSELRGVPLHPTQLIEAAAALAIFLVIDRRSWAPGKALAASVALYAALRFAVDFLRAGDPGLIAPLGLSLAQWSALAALAVSGWALRTR